MIVHDDRVIVAHLIDASGQPSGIDRPFTARFLSLLLQPFAILFVLRANPLRALRRELLVPRLRLQCLREQLQRELGISADGYILGKIANRNASVVRIARDLNHRAVLGRLALNRIPRHIALDHNDDVCIFDISCRAHAKMKIMRIRKTDERTGRRHHRRHQRFGEGHHRAYGCRIRAQSAGDNQRIHRAAQYFRGALDGFVARPQGFRLVLAKWMNRDRIHFLRQDFARQG